MGFVTQPVRTTLMNPEFPHGVASSVQALVDAHPQEASIRINAIRERLAVIVKRRNNLFRAIESGIGPDLIRSELGELRAEKIKLERETGLVAVEQILQSEVLIAESAVRDFVADLEHQFANGSLPLRKRIGQQCARTIEIDPDRRLARCHVRLIPPVTTNLLGIQADQMKNEKAPRRGRL